MTERNFFNYKDEQSLHEQVNRVGSQFGEHLYSSDEELDKMLAMSPEDLKDNYPYKYSVYIESLKNNPSPEAKLLLKQALIRVKAINNLERFNSETARGAKLGSSEYELLSHQKDVMHDLLSFFESGDLKEDAGEGKRGWIQLPTGSGKTFIFAALVNATGLRSLILVPNLNLIQQTREEFEKLYPGISVTSYSGEGKDISGDVVISTYQSLHSLDSLLQEEEQGFDLVICDEAHRALTERVVSHALDSIGQGGVSIGLTATPKFNESKQVGEHFGELIHEMPIEEAIIEDILSGVRCVYVETDIDLSDAEIKGGDYNEKRLEELLDVAKRNQACITMAQREEFKGKGQIAFCVSIQHAKSLAKAATEQGLKAVAITGELDKNERNAIFEDYKDGKIDMLCTVDLLTEGWNSPRTEVGHMLRPTKSLVVAEQRAGRCLRKNEGKEMATIIDYLDKGEKSSEFRPITMVDILGGAVVLPRALAEKLQEQASSQPADASELNLPGIRLIMDQEEVMRIHNESRKPRLESREQVIEILNAEGFNDIGQMIHDPLYYFTEHRFSTTYFTGTGSQLVTKYFREIRGENLAKGVTQESFNLFMKYMFGEDAIKEARSNLEFVDFSDGMVGDFLHKVIDMTEEEIMAKDFSIKERGNKQHSVFSGAQILQVLRRKYGPEVGFDHQGKRKIAISTMTRKNAEPMIDKLERKRLYNEVLENGEFLDVLRTSNELYFITQEDFSNLVLHFPQGDISGKRLLEYYGLKGYDETKFWQIMNEQWQIKVDKEKLERDMLKMFQSDPYFGSKSYDEVKQSSMRVNSQFGYFEVKLMPMLNYLDIWHETQFRKWVSQALNPDVEVKSQQNLRERVKELFRDSKPSRYLTLEEFVSMKFKIQDNLTLTGLEAMQKLGIKANHKEYRELIDSFMGERFCREFWPRRQALTKKIIKDSIEYHARFPGVFKLLKPGQMPDYKSFCTMRVVSDYIEEENQFNVVDGEDLLQFWKGSGASKELAPKRAEVTESDYQSFIEWLGKMAK